jgi:antitoxin component YwqK of YwqJK toxin-antitoxin module
MFNKIIFTILITAVLFACSPKYTSQEISCLQIVDRNGLTETISSKEKLVQFKNKDFEKPQSYQKVLRIYNKDKMGNTSSKITCYHENGQIWKFLEIKNARAFGMYKEWYPNGNLKIEANVIGGSADFLMQNDWLFDGISKVYDENGKLISQFTYLKGALHGETKHYFPTSELSKVIPYFNNDINGEVIEYTKMGEVLSKITYKNGKREGPSVGYWNKDNISFIEDYENDLLINGQYFKKSRVKISKIKNGDGQKAIFENENLQKLIEYKNGRPEGKTQIFSLNGHLINEYYQKNNVKDGLEIEYFNENEVTNFNRNNHPPKLEIVWNNGSIHGQVKTWYKNNKMESQKEFSHNKKNGMHFAWYENSSVMFIEEYENDILIKGSYYKIDEKNPTSTIINGNGITTLFDSKGRFIKKINYKDGHPIQ